MWCNFVVILFFLSSFVLLFYTHLQINQKDLSTARETLNEMAKCKRIALERNILPPLDQPQRSETLPTRTDCNALPQILDKCVSVAVKTHDQVDEGRAVSEPSRSNRLQLLFKKRKGRVGKKGKEKQHKTDTAHGNSHAQTEGRKRYSQEDIEACKNLFCNWFHEQDNLGPPAIVV